MFESGVASYIRTGGYFQRHITVIGALEQRVPIVLLAMFFPCISGSSGPPKAVAKWDGFVIRVKLLRFLGKSAGSERRHYWSVAAHGRRRLLRLGLGNLPVGWVMGCSFLCLFLHCFPERLVGEKNVNHA